MNLLINLHAQPHKAWVGLVTPIRPPGKSFIFIPLQVFSESLLREDCIRPTAPSELLASKGAEMQIKGNLCYIQGASSHQKD